MRVFLEGLRAGDQVVIDTAPLMASPVPTGRECTVEVLWGDLQPGPGQVYVSPGLLYIDRKWILRRDPLQGA